MTNILNPAYILLLVSSLYFSLPTIYAQTFQPSKETLDYQGMVDFFVAWREFRAPVMIDGVPDYTAQAMQLQQKKMADWQSRLAALDTTGWPIKHQVDWYLVWAEMNGLDFAHRVKIPWSRDPAFYVWFYPFPTDVPEREGPNIYGAIELPNYQWPLSKTNAKEIADRLSKAPEVFQQARTNLIGDAKDLWILGTRSIREQSTELEVFAQSVIDTYPDLASTALKVRDASNQFADWLDKGASSKTELSGVGKDNYTWNLKKVHLLPYSWDDEVLIMKRELARAHSSLRLEENRNKDLPKLSQIKNAEDYDQLLNQAVTEYIEFLEKKEIIPMKDYMEPALRAKIGSYSPSDGLRGFFSEITYRGPIVMRTHHYHWIDLARMRDEPNQSPIRRKPLFYNIFDGRAEGMATGMEEMMMHTGLLDDKPRARELIWILLAQRAARGLGGLFQHGLEMDFDKATQFASKWTPWGLLPADGSTIQFEEHFYLRQPGYGTSYVIGKIEIEKLIAEYARQREGNFVLKQFMDDFNNAGVIPVSLIYWELTGDKSMLEAAIGEH